MSQEPVKPRAAEQRAALETGMPMGGPLSNVVAPNCGPSRSSVPRTILYLVGVVAVVWWACLVGMTLFTANPIILSCAQIDKSEIVVTARRLPDAEQDVVSIEQVEFGTMPKGTARVHFLADTKMPVGPLFVLPLSTASGRLAVTRLKGQDPKSPGRIYPATPEVTEQLRKCLANR